MAHGPWQRNDGTELFYSACDGVAPILFIRSIHPALPLPSSRAVCIYRQSATTTTKTTTSTTLPQPIPSPSLRPPRTTTHHYAPLCTTTHHHGPSSMDPSFVIADRDPTPTRHWWKIPPRSARIRGNCAEAVCRLPRPGGWSRGF
ncbi:hypothetical protein BO71DRAFT_252952 [Aspergillus ellipticus CBS 707.79]|uniref:Uncharacterized protein n=1 Tax=Aspergillus ellipticus CBS 707.79 TaxID=1448320 RepID=A0A319DHI7_9EURO|nr:hypothetical protein BO71DRAFT_252952 [Aspergillus ellipticus CBS 707.79]